MSRLINLKLCVMILTGMLMLAPVKAQRLSESIQLKGAALSVERTVRLPDGRALPIARALRVEVNNYLYWLDAQTFTAHMERDAAARGLAAYRDVLREISVDPSNPDNLNLISQIASDFNRRNKVVSGNLGAANPLPLVKLSLRAIVTGSGNEIQHVQAGYIAEALIPKENKYRINFPKLTPIVEYFILPGRYLFFVDISGQRAGSVVADVGLNGSSLEAVDVPIKAVVAPR